MNRQHPLKSPKVWRGGCGCFKGGNTVFVPDGLISLGQVSYAEVEHWMWRLFLDDFGQVCEDLGLSPLPVSAFLQTDLPRPTPLLYGVSSVVLPRQPYWPER